MRPKKTEPVVLRPEVFRFALEMETKLFLNDHKGGWHRESALWLLERLYEEASELRHSIDSGCCEEIRSEAADVANFAMMIAEKAAQRRLGVADARKDGSMESFEKDLAALINRFSLENESNTPDYVLAQFMKSCLDAFTIAVQQRETFYGRDARPSIPNSTHASRAD